MKEGDIVHIIVQDAPSVSHYVINNNKGLIVVNPDLLISGTTVVSTVQCMRRSVKARINLFGDITSIYLERHLLELDTYVMTKHL